MLIRNAMIVVLAALILVGCGKKSSAPAKGAKEAKKAAAPPEKAEKPGEKKEGDKDQPPAKLSGGVTSLFPLNTDLMIEKGDGSGERIASVRLTSDKHEWKTASGPPIEQPFIVRAFELGEQPFSTLAHHGCWVLWDPANGTIDRVVSDMAKGCEEINTTPDGATCPDPYETLMFVTHEKQISPGMAPIHQWVGGSTPIGASRGTIFAYKAEVDLEGPDKKCFKAEVWDLLNSYMHPPEEKIYVGQSKPWRKDDKSQEFTGAVKLLHVEGLNTSGGPGADGGSGDPDAH